MQKINLELTVEEVNQILTGLGSMPYTQVFQLINTIQMQAATQLDHGAEQPQATNGVGAEQAD